MMRSVLAGVSWMTVAAMTASPLSAGADELTHVLDGRPAFSAPEQPAQSWGRCTDIRAMAEGLPDMDDRIDLSVSGAVSEMKTDGVLWYVVLCNTPDVKVLCVTYSANDLKVGDTAYAKGGYRRIDANHALLDPCLASDRSEWLGCVDEHVPLVIPGCTAGADPESRRKRMSRWIPGSRFQRAPE